MHEQNCLGILSLVRWKVGSTQLHAVFCYQFNSARLLCFVLTGFVILCWGNTWKTQGSETKKNAQQASAERTRRHVGGGCTDSHPTSLRVASTWRTLIHPPFSRDAWHVGQINPVASCVSRTFSLYYTNPFPICITTGRPRVGTPALNSRHIPNDPCNRNPQNLPQRNLTDIPKPDTQAELEAMQVDEAASLGLFASTPTSANRSR